LHDANQAPRGLAPEKQCDLCIPRRGLPKSFALWHEPDEDCERTQDPLEDKERAIDNESELSEIEKGAERSYRREGGIVGETSINSVRPPIPIIRQRNLERIARAEFEPKG